MEIGSEHVQPLPRRADPSPAMKANAELRQQAVRAAIWATPIVSFDAMRQAFFRDAGARYGDFVYLSEAADAGFQITTPNASSRYVYFNFNLKDGPAVLEIPPAIGAGLFGSLLDAWQVPIADVGPHGADQGKGGKYLLLPPNNRVEAPAPYLPVRFDTNNGYGALRAIPEGSSPEAVQRAIGLVKQMRLYPWVDAASPPPSRFIDISGKLFDGIIRFDESYYGSLARIIAEEPLFPRDMNMMNWLRGLGIERQKPFAPDDAMEILLGDAAREAHSLLLSRAPNDGNHYWPDRQWRTASAIGAKTGFIFETEKGLDTDARGVFYFLTCAPPRVLGKASFYLSSHLDAAGKPLTGEARYRLRVPANPPARQFWALTIYDCENAAFFRDAQKVEINSYSDLRKNRDGSIDLDIGGNEPSENAANWVGTTPGRRWFTIFRLYGPTKALFDKSWKLPDIERI